MMMDLNMMTETDHKKMTDFQYFRQTATTQETLHTFETQPREQQTFTYRKG
jgi:hypothetical protein